jgi:hypothetical protein
MKTRQVVCIIILVSLSLSSAGAQSNFNVDEYYQFLSDHTDLKSQALLAMYPPPTTYWSRSADPTDLEAYDYLDSIRIKYELTDDELSALQDRHFTVTERLSFVSMGEALIDIFRKDLPVFISTDAILHALHKSYDEILKNMELTILIPDLQAVLDAIYAAYPDLLSQYQSNPQMADALGDVDLYITMAKSLLEGTPAAPQLVSTAYFNQYWDAVHAEQYTGMPLFTTVDRELDFSQFTVRGHYAESEELSRYFQSMMWLGRMDFLLTQPPGSLPAEDIHRMHIGSVLLDELLDRSGGRGRLDEIDAIITFMVGESDNLTPGELQAIIASENVQHADDLLDDTVYDSFFNAVAQSPYSDQKILSSIFSYSGTTEPPPLPVSFRLCGQRFIIDSYIFSRVVFPWIQYQGSNIWRPMPDPLDAMFALGNDDALQLIQNDLETYNYSSNLAGVRYLVDAYDDEFWSQSLYNTWLSSLRALNPPTNDTDLPFFMKTTGWHQQKLNTQLASWTQLRHDNLLYAKQSYTGGGGCYYPYGYVEPYPEFYRRLGSFAERAGVYFSDLDEGVGSDLSAVTEYFTRMGAVADTLETLASKELEGTPFNEDEEDFLKRVLTSDWSPGNSRGEETPADGWYVRLFFGDEMRASELAYGEDYLVADVHTQPTGRVGDIVGRVLHVGVGNVNLGIYLVEQTHDTCAYRAYVGPAMSYYEHITEDFDRLTDERWAGMVYDDVLPARPDWVNVYLVDPSGTKYATGRELQGMIYLGVEPPVNSQPSHFMLSQNYPNPFNPVTTIGYDLPLASEVRLTIYDLLGREVTGLVDGYMEPGHHEVQWNGQQLPSGIYIARLVTPEYSKSIKMVLLK